MKIVEVRAQTFTYKTNTMRDTDGHTHPGPERDATGGLLTITTDEDVTGHTIASPADIREDLLAAFVRPVLVGQDPLRIEKLWQGMYHWQRGSGGRLTDRVLCAVELALWDLVGKATKQPVWKLLGGYHDRILAYGSTIGCSSRRTFPEVRIARSTAASMSFATICARSSTIVR